MPSHRNIKYLFEEDQKYFKLMTMIGFTLAISAFFLTAAFTLFLNQEYRFFGLIFILMGYLLFSPIPYYLFYTNKIWPSKVLWLMKYASFFAHSFLFSVFWYSAAWDIFERFKFNSTFWSWDNIAYGFIIGICFSLIPAFLGRNAAISEKKNN